MKPTTIEVDLVRYEADSDADSDADKNAEGFYLVFRLDTEDFATMPQALLSGRTFGPLGGGELEARAQHAILVMALVKLGPALVDVTDGDPFRADASEMVFGGQVCSRMHRGERTWWFALMRPGEKVGELEARRSPRLVGPLKNRQIATTLNDAAAELVNVLFAGRGSIEYERRA